MIIDEQKAWGSDEHATSWLQKLNDVKLHAEMNEAVFKDTTGDEGWVMEFGIGLIQILALQLLAGLWVYFVIRKIRTSRAFRVVLTMTGLACIANVTSRVFDPERHFIAAMISCYALGFFAPLQALKLLDQQKVIDEDGKMAEKAGLRLILASVAFPAARPSRHHRAASISSLVSVGSILFASTYALTLYYPTIVGTKNIVITNLWCCILLFVGVGGVNCLTTAMFGIVAGEEYEVSWPFGCPLLTKSVGAFWSVHWNVSVHQALYRGVFLPLIRSNGKMDAEMLRRRKAAATMACFLVSGVAHEIVLLYVNIKVGESRGEWMLMFLLNGIVTVAEARYRKQLKKVPQIVRALIAQTFLVVSASTFFYPLAFRLGLLDRAYDNVAKSVAYLWRIPPLPLQGVSALESI